MSQPGKVFINSDHRNEGTTADNFSVNLETVIERPTSILLRTATIPLTCYNIPSYESKFWWYIPGPLVGGSPTWLLKSLSVNCQRAFTSVVQLVNQFNADSIAQAAGLTLAYDPDPTSASYSQYGANSFKYRVTLTSTNTFRLPGYMDVVDPQGNTITATGNSTQPFYFNFNQRLGFANRYISAQYAGNTAVAEAPPNIQRTSAINIRCSLGCDSLSSQLPGGSSLRDIMLSVPCSQIYGDICIYKEPSNTGRLTKNIPQYVRSINIQLLDDQYNALELPSNNISSYEFDFNYD